MVTMLITLTCLFFIPKMSLKHHEKNTVLLLLPDLNSDPILIQIWKDAAQKEGIQLEVMTDNEFRLPINQQHLYYKGIILSDSIHARMSRSLADNLKSYVNTGGHVMLVYDAGTQNLQGQPYQKGSLFSSILHVDYGTLVMSGEQTNIMTSTVGQSDVVLKQLGVLPENFTLTAPDTHLYIGSHELFYALSSSEYGPLMYQHFLTKPINTNIPLILTTPDHQFIAGIKSFGKGDILFVNLPLTFLSLGKDTMLMHIFLRHFATHILKLSIPGPIHKKSPLLVSVSLPKNKPSVRAIENKKPLVKQAKTKTKTTPFILTKSHRQHNLKHATMPPMPIMGYVEGGALYGYLTSGYGTWSNQYLRTFAQISPKNSVGLLVTNNYEYREHGDYIALEQVHVFNENWYTNFNIGTSNSSIYLPKYNIGGKVFRKLMPNRALVAYLGVRAYRWRPTYSTQDINPGLIYYFKKPWIVEMGTYINRSNPGNIYSASVYTVVTQGSNKHHYLTLRLGIGKEAYLPLGTGVPAAVGYFSTVVTGTWRQWWGCNWGTNIAVENYYNPFYKRYAATVGLFKDFSI